MSVDPDFAPVDFIPSRRGRGRPRGSALSEKLFPADVRDTVREASGSTFRLTSTAKATTSTVLRKAFPIEDHGFKFTGVRNEDVEGEKPSYSIFVQHVGTDFVDTVKPEDAPAQTAAESAAPVDDDEPDADWEDESMYDETGAYVG